MPGCQRPSTWATKYLVPCEWARKPPNVNAILSLPPATVVRGSSPTIARPLRSLSYRRLRRLVFLRIVGYSTVLYCTLPYSTLLYSTLLYSTLLYSTLLYSTLLYCTALHCIVAPHSFRSRIAANCRRHSMTFAPKTLSPAILKVRLSL
jgi:hypothetical protein